MLLAVYSHYMVSDPFERSGPALVFTFMLGGRLVVWYQVRSFGIHPHTKTEFWFECKFSIVQNRRADAKPKLPLQLPLCSPNRSNSKRTNSLEQHWSVRSVRTDDTQSVGCGWMRCCVLWMHRYHQDQTANCRRHHHHHHLLPKTDNWNTNQHARVCSSSQNIFSQVIYYNIYTLYKCNNTHHDATDSWSPLQSNGLLSCVLRVFRCIKTT